MRGPMRRGLVLALCLALWPALVSAAPPEPQGALVYSDDFSDPARSGLEDNVNATDYSRGFHAPGVYHLRLLKSDDTHWSLFPRQAYGSFTFEVDVWDNSDNFVGDVSQGVVVRAVDQSHFYTVLVDARKGRYAVRKMDGGEWSDLVTWTESPLVRQESEVNHIRLDGTGDKFTVYLNGDLLGSFADAAYAHGGLGLIASNSDATEPHSHFDNVRIYAAEGKASASNLPGTGTPLEVVGLVALTSLALLLLGTGLWTRRLTPPPRR
jgi:hypothetical protein